MASHLHYAWCKKQEVCNRHDVYSVVFSSTKRSVVNGIFINLFVFMAPVFPLLVFGMFYEWNEKRYYAGHGNYEGFLLKQYLPYAEIAGPVLFLVLLATYINKLYRRWYSLPEN